MKISGYHDQCNQLTAVCRPLTLLRQPNEVIFSVTYSRQAPLLTCTGEVAMTFTIQEFFLHPSIRMNNSFTLWPSSPLENHRHYPIQGRMIGCQNPCECGTRYSIEVEPRLSLHCGNLVLLLSHSLLRFFRLAPVGRLRN